MTVVSVVGSINGHYVTFIKREDDFWDCNPGDTPDGRYVSEFWATDEAGNIGYRLAVLYIYDGRCVKIEWIEDEISLKYISDRFDIEFTEDTFDISFSGLENYILVDYIEDAFDISIVKCEGVKI